MTRVLHVITGLHAGGAETQLPLLVDDPRWTAEVVSLTGHGVVTDRLRALGVPVHALGMAGNRDLRALRRLARLVRGGGYDVVHLHLFRSLVFGAPAARLARVPRVVFTEHSLNRTLVEGRPVTPGVRALYRAATALVDAVVAVSPGVRDRLVALGVPARKVAVVPNALAEPGPAPSRSAARTRLGLPGDATVVGVLGRLAAPKRVDVLLEAAAPLLGPGTRLLVVGDGDERGRLEALAEDLGVAAWVLFAGETPDVPAALAAMDLLASPSPEETFGLAVVEARLAGLPVVYADCPGLDATADDDDAAHRVPSDVPALRAALRGLLARPLPRTPPPPELARRASPGATRDLLAPLYGLPLPAPLTGHPA